LGSAVSPQDQLSEIIPVLADPPDRLRAIPMLADPPDRLRAIPMLADPPDRLRVGMVGAARIELATPAV
jgi:hypothetical protein